MLIGVGVREAEILLIQRNISPTEVGYEHDI